MAEIVDFPRNAGKATKKPDTTFEILHMAPGMTAEELVTAVGARFPELTLSQLIQSLEKYIEQKEAKPTNL